MLWMKKKLLFQKKSKINCFFKFDDFSFFDLPKEPHCKKNPSSTKKILRYWLTLHWKFSASSSFFSLVKVPGIQLALSVFTELKKSTHLRAQNWKLQVWNFWRNYLFEFFFQKFWLNKNVLNIVSRLASILWH